MKYNKPEIIELGNAVHAVQTTGKAGTHLDNIPEPTSCAYEADE